MSNNYAWPREAPVPAHGFDLCDGPVVLGTGPNYDARWAVWVATAGIRIGKWNGEVMDDEFGQVNGSFDPGVRPSHVSMCFDPAAKPVIAIQDGTDIKVRKIVSGTPTEFSFEGKTPLMFNNAVAYGSDVFVIYIKDAGDQIFMRMSSEDFGTERPLNGGLNTTLSELTKTDIVTIGSNLYHAIWALDTNGKVVFGRSDLYPAPACPVPSSFPTANMASDTYGIFTMAHHEPTGTLWCPDENDGQIYVFNIADGTLATVIDAQAQMTGLAPWQMVWDEINDQMVTLSDGDYMSWWNPYDYSFIAALNGVCGNNGNTYNQMAYDSTRGNLLVQDTNGSRDGTTSVQTLVDGLAHTIITSNSYPGKRLGNPVYVPTTDRFYFWFEDDEEMRQVHPTSLVVTGTGFNAPNSGEFGLFCQWIGGGLDRLMVGFADSSGNVLRVSAVQVSPFAIEGTLNGDEVGSVIWNIQAISYNTCNNQIYVADFDNVIRFDTSGYAEIGFTAADGCISLVFIHDQNLTWIMQAFDPTFDHAHLFTI